MKFKRANHSYSAGGEPLKIIYPSKEKMKITIEKIRKRKHIGTELVDWERISFKAGKGILNELDRCYWTIDGERINLVKSAICGTRTVYQSINKDPFYRKKQ